MGSALNKTHGTKTVKYSTQHYCTAVANSVLMEINVGTGECT